MLMQILLHELSARSRLRCCSARLARPNCRRVGGLLKEGKMIKRSARRALERASVSMIVAVGAALGGYKVVHAQGNPTASQAHIDAATAAAGTDLRGWLELCRPQPPVAQEHRPGMASQS